MEFVELLHQLQVEVVEVVLKLETQEDLAEDLVEETQALHVQQLVKVIQEQQDQVVLGLLMVI
jgi:hypothetical protein|tara:strand:+ start:331 stop:519 length:189 start_codon:yes stop_codon:yes gene_type:complete